MLETTPNTFSPRGGPTGIATFQYPLDPRAIGAIRDALPRILPDVIVQRRRVQYTLPAGATSFDVASAYMVLTAPSAVTVATVKGGREGMVLTLQFADANVTITDTGTGAADAVNLSAAFTSTANDVLQLLHDGTSWREVGRGGNVLTLSGGTLTGTITLGENTSIALDPAGSADGKWSGETVAGTGGATIAFGDLVTLDKDDSRWELVDISVAAAATGDARGVLGMAVTSSTDGGALTVLLDGIIRADANFPTLTIGAPVYASTTGDVVVTQPTTADHVIRVVGFGLTADEMRFNPSSDYTTHV